MELIRPRRLERAPTAGHSRLTLGNACAPRSISTRVIGAPQPRSFVLNQMWPPGLERRVDRWSAVVERQGPHQPRKPKPRVSLNAAGGMRFLGAIACRRVSPSTAITPEPGRIVSSASAANVNSRSRCSAELVRRGDRAPPCAARRGRCCGAFLSMRHQKFHFGSPPGAE